MKRYESAIRVMTSFFAVLLGFGLKRLLDTTDFWPPGASGPCFILAVLLFMRFLIGSIELSVNHDITRGRLEPSKRR